MDPPTLNEKTRERIIRRVHAALAPFTEELNNGPQSCRYQAIGVAEIALREWAMDQLKHEPEQNQ